MLRGKFARPAINLEQDHAIHARTTQDQAEVYPLSLTPPSSMTSMHTGGGSPPFQSIIAADTTHISQVASIRRIPPELLGEIFIHAVDLEARTAYSSDSESYYGSERIGGGENYHIISPRPHRPPLIFAEICSEWRVIALSTPHLWNSMSLKVTGSKMQANILLCETWMKRSGSLPISIRLYRKPGSSPRSTKKLIGTILPHAHRWRWLELDVPALSYHILGDIPPGSIPNLEYLSINHDNPELEQALIGSSRNPWAAFQNAPKLNDLYFDCIGAALISTSAERPTFPWSQLIHIDVGDCSLDDCLQILAQASTAIFCIFHVTRHSPSLQFHASFIHPRLRTLKIDSFIDIQLFWTAVTCSALSTLSLELHGRGEVGGAQDLAQFLARCGGTIEDLTLSQSSLNETQFITCLRDMPRLRRLDIYEDHDSATFTDRVAEALTLAPVFVDEPSPPLIPKLVSLSLSGGWFCSDAYLTRMLESRIPGQDEHRQEPLEHLFLYICRKMSRSVTNRLISFRKQGVAVDLCIDCDSMSDSDHGTGSEEGESSRNSDSEDSNSPEDDGSLDG